MERVISQQVQVVHTKIDRSKPTPLGLNGIRSGSGRSWTPLEDINYILWQGAKLSEILRTGDEVELNHMFGLNNESIRNGFRNLESSKWIPWHLTNGDAIAIACINRLGLSPQEVVGVLNTLGYSASIRPCKVGGEAFLAVRRFPEGTFLPENHQYFLGPVTTTRLQAEQIP